MRVYARSDGSRRSIHSRHRCAQRRSGSTRHGCGTADRRAGGAFGPARANALPQGRRAEAAALPACRRAAALSELRFNELRGEQVVYAIHRQDRTFLPDREHCPLDPTKAGGPETEIPFPAFEIAVFDNRFPAFEAPDGAAEVVVYTDDHHGSFAQLAPDRARDLMWVWRQRYEELGAREDISYVLIFE